MGIIKQCTHSHSAPPTTHPKTFPTQFQPTKNNAPLTTSHSHPPKIFCQQPRPTQSNASYTPNHSNPPKIFSQPLPPTQNNVPTHPHPTFQKFLYLIPTHQKHGSANLISSPLQNYLTVHMTLWLQDQVTWQTRNKCPRPQCVWPSKLVRWWLRLTKSV